MTSWITVIWSANAGICLTLAAVQLLVWVKSRDSWANLAFAIAAAAAAANAILEMSLMRAQTPEQFGELLRWYHVPLGVLVVSLIWFVRLYLRAGRLWLAWLVTGLRVVVLALTFSLDPNLNFREITGLNPIHIWGETIVVAIGEKNPWTNITHASGILFLVFAVDAAFSAWRQGERRRAAVVGVTFGTAIVMALVLSEMLNRGTLPVPYTLSFLFLIILMGIAYELGVDVVRASQLSRELRESQERMRLATSGADIGVWDWDIAKDEMWVTDNIRARRGLSKFERINLERFLQWVRADDGERVRRTIRAALESAEDFEVEYRAIGASGATHWVLAHGQVERNQRGDPLRIRGVSMDITERKRLEQRFRATVESAPMAMVMIDREGKMALVNAEAERLFGYGREEMIGQAVEMLLPERDRAPHPHLRTSFFASPHSRRMGMGRELFALRKDGSNFPVEIGLSPVQTEEGLFVLSTIADITERKQTEAELRERRAELAHIQRVSAMGQLSSALAHEINQPLGAILRNSEAAELFLQQDPPDLEELRAILIDIRRDEQRAVAVIERMRSLLKRGEPRFRKLAVDNLVEQVAALLRAEFQARHVMLRLETPHGLPKVRGDRVQLQQVMLNLLLNSLDASDGQLQGQRQVVIRASQTEDGIVEIAVVDHGKGIPPDLLPRVFELFFTTKSAGIGIGLAISKSIVELHGGQISVENNPEGGATFRFTLRVAQSEGEE